MPNSHLTDNRAVNRATCSLFIERSLAGFARPCDRCPQSRVLQDKDDWGYFDTCPCGHERRPYYNASIDLGGLPCI